MCIKNKNILKISIGNRTRDKISRYDRTIDKTDRSHLETSYNDVWMEIGNDDSFYEIILPILHQIKGDI